jgi:hypothetical protein
VPQGITYVLGKDCKLFIDEEEIPGVADIAIRESTTDVDATGYGQRVSSTAVIARGLELMISMPDIEAARSLNRLKSLSIEATSIATQPTGPAVGTFFLPQLIRIRLEGGLREVTGMFTIHQIDYDEMLDGAVVPRFSLRLWGGDAKEEF